MNQPLKIYPLLVGSVGSVPYSASNVTVLLAAKVVSVQPLLFPAVQFPPFASNVTTGVFATPVIVITMSPTTAVASIVRLALCLSPATVYVYALLVAAPIVTVIELGKSYPVFLENVAVYATPLVATSAPVAPVALITLFALIVTSFCPAIHCA